MMSKIVDGNTVKIKGIIQVDVDKKTDEESANLNLSVGEFIEKNVDGIMKNNDVVS